MQQFDANFTAPVEGNRQYGLGVWKGDDLGCQSTVQGGTVNKSIPGVYPYLSYVGHAGDEYGTVTRSGYHATFDFGFSMMVNRRYALDGGPNPRGVFCAAWKVLWRALGQPAAPAILPL